MTVPASVLARRQRWPDAETNNGPQWVRSDAVLLLVTFHNLKTAQVGSFWGRGKSKGGVGSLEEVVCVCAGVFADRRRQ